MFRLAFATVVACFLAPGPALAYSSGAGSCDYPPSWAMSASQPGTGGYTVTVSKPSYTPGETLTITVSGAIEFKGFLIQSVRGSPGAPNVSQAGTFSALPSNTRFADACGNPDSAVTHSQTNPSRTSVVLSWTAPPSGTGTVTFHAVVVRSIGEWYGQTNLVTATITEVAVPRDCVVGAYGDWGTCTAACGGGEQTRTRPVLVQAANGGAACPVLVESRACNEQPCPIDCAVSDWTDWGDCSVACGGGTQQRSREVTQSAANGGAICPALTESRLCNTQGCPVDCTVGAFSDWGSCSKNCGGGLRTRSRPVVTEAANGGAACPVLEESETCNTQPCPVDCVVSEWEAFGTCSATCGGGTHTRKRTVVTPASNGGAVCPPLEETASCNTQGCPVACVVSDWSAFSECSAECGGGESARTRTVVTPASNGGIACPALRETVACKEEPCPGSCTVSDWTDWGTCNTTCGGGTQTRTRTMTGGAAPCPALEETRACNEQACPIDCVLSDWSGFGTCSVTCGGGTKIRTRSIITASEHGGAACGVLEEAVTCNVEPCPIDCVASEWSDWATCSVTCGGGTQARTRSVVTSAAHGGVSCGDLEETRACNGHACPIDCVVSDWADASSCSVACGGGTAVRTRTVVTPSANGGVACPPLAEEVACNEQPCPSDCVVSDWSEWGTCSAECGGGSQERTRTITASAANGGVECPALEESRACGTEACRPDCEATGALSWSQTIGTDGGRVELCGARLDLPAGALADDAAIELTRLESGPALDVGDRASDAYRIAGATFLVPVRLTLVFSGSSERLSIRSCPDATGAGCTTLASVLESDGVSVSAELSASGIVQVVRAPEEPQQEEPKPEDPPAGCGCGGGAASLMSLLVLVPFVRRRRVR